MDSPGYIPGYHVPGTLVPIGAAVEHQRQAERQAAAEIEAQRQRRNLVLLLR